MATGTKKLLLAMAASILAVSVSFAAGAQEKTVLAQQPAGKPVEIVRITPMLGIKPETAAIKKGTTIVWVNQLEEPVEILFTAKQVTRACLSPTNFAPNKNGLFQSSWIEPQGVASLCFIESGKYGYVVSAKSDRDRSSGKEVKPLSGFVQVQ